MVCMYHHHIIIKAPRINSLFDSLPIAHTRIMTFLHFDTRSLAGVRLAVLLAIAACHITTILAIPTPGAGLQHVAPMPPEDPSIGRDGEAGSAEAVYSTTAPEIVTETRMYGDSTQTIIYTTTASTPIGLATSTTSQDARPTPNGFGSNGGDYRSGSGGGGGLGGNAIGAIIGSIFAIMIFGGIGYYLYKVSVVWVVGSNGSNGDSSRASFSYANNVDIQKARVPFVVPESQSSSLSPMGGAAHMRHHRRARQTRGTGMVVDPEIDHDLPVYSERLESGSHEVRMVTLTGPPVAVCEPRANDMDDKPPEYKESCCNNTVVAPNIPQPSSAPRHDRNP